MPRQRPMHPSDRKRLDRLLDAPLGGTVRLRPAAENRVSIIVNGRSVGTLSTDLAERAALRPGRPWTPELAARVAKAITDDIAREAAARLLAQRERSTGELLARLKRRGIKPERADRLVAELACRGDVNDERFANLLARSIARDKPVGPRLIRAKLREKRIDRATAERAADDALAGRDPREDALTLARARLRVMPAGLDDQARARRLTALLARRGFDEDTAEHAVQALLPSLDTTA